MKNNVPVTFNILCTTLRSLDDEQTRFHQPTGFKKATLKSRMFTLAEDGVESGTSTVCLDDENVEHAVGYIRSGLGGKAVVIGAWISGGIIEFYTDTPVPGRGGNSEELRAEAERMMKA